MSNERDQGLAALQGGDYVTAVTMLESACRQDPNDFQAYLYLGGAYHQVRRFADSVHALTHAVQLQPANPQARYNLAVALEQADRPAEAVTALQAALALKPDYAVAQQMLQRLQRPPAPQAQVNPTLYGAPAAQYPTAQPLAGYGAAPLNPAETPPAPSYGAPPLYGAPPQPPQGAYGQPVPPPNYGYPPRTAGGYGYAPAAQQSYTNYGYEDSFSLGDAFQNFIQILISPRTFFADQAGCEGFLAPMAMLLLYMLMFGIGYMGMMFAIGSRLGVAGMAAIFMLPFVLGIGYVIALVLLAVGAGFLHLLGFMFGNKAAYSGTFRALTYAYAPSMVISSLVMMLMPLMIPRTASVIPTETSHRVVLAQYNPGTNPPPDFGRGPGMSNSSNYSGTTSTTRAQPIVMSPEIQMLQTIISVISWAWGGILLVIALHHIQRIPIGGAIAVVAIYYLTLIGLGFALKQAAAAAVGQ
jgi:hypothetical protein